RVALPRLALDGRPAGEAQPQQAGDLVERLAGRIVQRGTEQVEVKGTLAVEQQSVPAADDEPDAGEDVAARGQPAGVDVPLDVVDAHQRDAQGDRQHLGGAEPDQQSADQPGCVVDGDTTDL